jgi:hypothetical protein
VPGGTEIIQKLLKEMKGASHKILYLRVLSSFCFSNHFSSYHVEDSVAQALSEMCESDESTSRLVLTCIANMLMRSGKTAQALRDPVFELLQNLVNNSKTLNSASLKLISATLRALHYLLPNLSEEEPSQVLSVFFAIQKVLYIGTVFQPRQSQGRFSSSSDPSDSDGLGSTNEFYYSKIKIYSLYSLQTLFKKYSKLLFSYWASCFNSAEAGFITTKLSKQPSLFYLLVFDKQVKVKISICNTISVILENSPLSKWLGRLEVEHTSKSFTPLSKSLAQIVKNMHEAMTYVIKTETNTQVLAAVFKTVSVMAETTPYSKMSEGMLLPLINGILKHMDGIEPSLRPALMTSLNSMIGTGFAEIEQILTPELMSKIFISLDVDNLPVLAKISRHFSHVISHELLMEKLIPCMKHDDSKYISNVFAVIEEIIRAGKAAKFGRIIVACVLISLRSDKSETSVPALNAISLLDCFDIFTRDQLRNVIDLLLEWTSQGICPSLKAVILKCFGAIIKADELPASYYNNVINLVLKSNNENNLSVAINASMTLACLCSKQHVYPYLGKIVSTICERSKNKKEKIVSNAIMAAGNLLAWCSREHLEENYLPLLTLCVNGLLHKNAKVGWDSAAALFKLFSNPDIPESEISDILIPQLLCTILKQPNFKTRISCCQLLRRYTYELKPHTRVILLSLIEALEEDKNAILPNFTDLKYQKTFRYEVVESFCHTLTIAEPSEISDIISERAVNIYEMLEGFLKDKIRDMIGRPITSILIQPPIQLVKQSASLLHEWALTHPDISVSFAVTERMNMLSRFSEDKVNELLNIVTVDDDIDIELKSQLTPHSPTPRKF